MSKLVRWALTALLVMAAIIVLAQLIAIAVSYLGAIMGE